MKKYYKKNELRIWFAEELSAFLGEGESHEILLRLLENEGMARLEWAIADGITIEQSVWDHYLIELKNDKPIQYIVGHEYFVGQKFIVNNHVLIPRPETAELVHWIVENYKHQAEIKILEIGTGSGCIALSLKKQLPQADVLATDISEGALTVARQNAFQLNLAVTFIKDDAFNTQIEAKAFDIIVSNPPYIPLNEALTLDKRVRNYEPSLALFTKENKPMQFYEAIIEMAERKLSKPGALYFEMHEDYALDVFRLAQKAGFGAIVKKDFYGKERMIQITRAAE